MNEFLQWLSIILIASYVLWMKVGILKSIDIIYDEFRNVYKKIINVIDKL